LHRDHVADKVASHVNAALWVYALLVVLITSTSWAIYWRTGDFLTRPLFGADNQFHDLTDYAGKTAHLYHGSTVLGRGLPQYNYPAPAAFVYKILIYTFPGHAVRTYLTLLAICVLCFALVAWRAGQPTREVRYSAAAAVITTAILSYPLWYDATLGNIEWIMWSLAAAGLCYLLRARYSAAAVLIGLSACIKPFSMLFLLLLLRRKKNKQALLGVATAGLVMLAALTALGPNPWKAYQNLKPGITIYTRDYVMNLRPVDEERFLHSLFDGMKSNALTIEMGGFRPHKAVLDVPILRAEPGGWHVVRTLLHVYPFVAITGFGLLLTVFYRMPILNQLTALAVAVTLFPPSAADYTLLHLYLPFGAFLVFLTREVAIGKAIFPYSSMLALSVIYALLFSPLTFLMIYAGDAKLLLLLALLFVAARSPMPCTYFGDPQTTG